MADLTRKELMNKHWKYYLMLENKFLNILNYVELTADNYNTYSNEFAAFLQIVGAELDVFFKRYCGYNLDDTRKNVAQYADSILTSYPDIRNQEISIIEKDMVIKPFEGWDKSRAKQSLFWWEAFDNVKHNRVDKFSDASLKNCLYSLSALFLLEMKYLSNITNNKKEADIPVGESKLFNLIGWKFRYLSMEGAFAVMCDEIEKIVEEDK